MKNNLTVGQIINTHGIKGEVKVFPLTDDIKRFRRLKSVIIDGIEKNIIWCKLQGDRVILKIEGIDDMETAASLRSKYIEVTRENAVKLSEGRYFIADIIGCNVFDENGIMLGTVDNVIQTGSNDVYSVKGKEEILIPALKDIVIKIDMEQRHIIIKSLDKWQ